MSAVWVDALLAGDERSWRGFRTAHAAARPAAARGVSAGQLACAERLVRTHPDLRDLDVLLARVLATPPAGRGPVDLPVVGDPDRPEWGPAPVEPDDLDATEVLRVAVPVLAGLLPPAPAPAAPARTPLRARRFVVHGAPGTAGAVAGALTAAGWVHGPFRATHLVVGCPPDVGVEQVWAHRVAAGGTRGWRRTWRVLHAAGALPAPLDVATLASRVAAELPGRHHASRLRVVVGPDARAVVATALGSLGVPAAPALDLDPATVDLQRRLHALPATPVPRHTAWVRTGPPAPAGRGLALGVPAPHRSWAGAQADRLALELDRLARGADYPVLGDPGSLARLRPKGQPTRVDPAVTLDRALAAIARAWQTRASAAGSAPGTIGIIGTERRDD